MSAFGQAFFSVNVGIGALLTYAAYLPDDVDLVKSSVIIAVGDTLVALLAGLMIFPIVFAHGLDPAQGPGLIFVTLSTAFGSMPGGAFIGAIFFVLVFLAALSSSCYPHTSAYFSAHGGRLGTSCKCRECAAVLRLAVNRIRS